MIEGSRDRRLYGAPGFLLHPTPTWVTAKPPAGQLARRPISVYTTVSELRFVSDDSEEIVTPTDPESYPSPCSPISRLHFASPEETMTLMTPIEFKPQSPNPSLSSSATDSLSSGIREEEIQMVPDEQPSRATHTTLISPRQPGWATPRLDRPAISDFKSVGRRPLPEVPGHAQSRPLPPRPTKMAVAPGLRHPERLSYPPLQEFVQGSSKNPLATSRPISDSGPDTRTPLVEEKRPEYDPTPGDTPPVHHTPSLPTINSPSPPPSSPIPDLHSMLHSPPPPLVTSVPILTTSEPRRPAGPILPSGDLLSPTSIDLVTAAGLTITGENGEETSFGALFKDRKVVVIFIRHFWCLFCQDYVRSISNSVTPEILGNKGVDLVLIGNGGPGMIKAYKKMLKFPFRVYTDSSLQLHDALGLYKTRDVETGGLYERGRGGSYVKHDGRWASLRVAVKVAAAKAVHIGDDDPGNLEQLGGEFVFGPGLKSSFVHKMPNRRGHAPIVGVLEAAGVDVREKVKVRESDVRAPTPSMPPHEVVDIDICISASTPEPPPSLLSTTITETTSAKASAPTDGEDVNLGLTIPVRVAGPLAPELPTPIIADEARWMLHRSQSLLRIKQRREARRRGGVVNA